MVGQVVKKKVMFLSGTWADLGGLNKMIATVSGMLATEYDVTVCSLDTCKPGMGYPLEKGVKYVELSPSDLYDVDKKIQDWGIDVFVGSNNCDIPYLDIYHKLSNSSVKTIMWNHEFFFLPYTQQVLYKVALYRKDIYKYPDAIVWLTETSANACYQYSTKIVVIGNSIKQDKKSGGLIKSSNRETLDIISIGRFDSRQKGIGRLLVMFSHLLALHENSVLRIVGRYDLSLQYSEDSNETVEQLIRRLDIPHEKIIFTGEIPNVVNLLDKSFVNVMTSEVEGFGLTVLESAERSIPSIVYSGGGQADVIEDGVTGVVIPYGDYERMAKAIVDLFHNNKAYSAMRQNSSRIVKHYSPTVIKDSWINLLNNLLVGIPPTSYVPPSLANFKTTAIYEGLLLKKTENLISLIDKGTDGRKRTFKDLLRHRK